jgi:translation initiation factor IF-3
MNILKLGKYYLENQERIKEFKRENKKITNKKAINLTVKINKSIKNK